MRQEEKILRILRLQFPTSWAPPPLGEAFADRKETHERLMRNIQEAKRQLYELSIPQLDVLLAVLEADPTAIRGQSIDYQELARPYNNPAANANFGHWAKADYWTLDEAVALLVSKEPSLITWRTVY